MVLLVTYCSHCCCCRPSCCQFKLLLGSCCFRRCAVSGILAVAGVPSPYNVFWPPFHYWCFHLCWRSLHCGIPAVVSVPAVFTSLVFLVFLMMLLYVMFLLSLLRLSTLLCRFLVGVGVPGVPRILAVAEVPLIGNIPSWTGVSSFSDVTAIVDDPTVVGVPAFAIVTADANVPAIAVVPALAKTTVTILTDYRSDTIGYRIRVSIFRTTWMDIGLKLSVGHPYVYFIVLFFDEKPH